MPSDNIYDYALPRIAEGIRKATGTVARTLGPKGSNIIIQSKLNPGMITTNDGATAIQAMHLSDPIENIGLDYAKEMADRSNNNSGDGSTTSLVLLNAILQEGIKSGVNTLEIKNSLDECLPIIEVAIHDQTKEITVEDVPAVARVAGENEALASTLGTIYRTIGRDGIIHLEGSGTYDTTFTLIEGVRFSGTGFLSSYMANKGKKAQYEKPAILVTKNKISKLDDINPLLAALVANETKTLVIFTDDMDSGVARLLIELQQNPIRKINILIIKAPVLWKQYIFEDFAKVTGATIIEDASGVTFKTLQLNHLGTCDTLICDKEETTVIGTADIVEHILELQEEADSGSIDAKLRLSWLTTKTAILKLGAKSETELSYLRLKAEDAIHSSRLALQSGIVAGGGVSLRNCANKMPDTVGGKILRAALSSPMYQIALNAGCEVRIDEIYNNGKIEWKIEESILIRTKGVINPISALRKVTVGLDAKNLEFVDMFEAGIVDATAIVLGAVRNSLGIASVLLTTNSVIILPPEKPQQPQFPWQN